MSKVLYWDNELKAQVERDATPEEEAEIHARLTAPLDRTSLAAQIDAAVAAVYAKPMTFSKEYEQREVQAKAFKDAAYSGSVPPRVAGFATPANMTPQDAADLILQQATQMRWALDQLSDLRMQKYAVTRAATDAEAQAVFDSAMASIAQIGASLA